MAADVWARPHFSRSTQESIWCSDSGTMRRARSRAGSLRSDRKTEYNSNWECPLSCGRSFPLARPAMASHWNVYKYTYKHFNRSVDSSPLSAYRFFRFVSLIRPSGDNVLAPFASLGRRRGSYTRRQQKEKTNFSNSSPGCRVHAWRPRPIFYYIFCDIHYSIISFRGALSANFGFGWFFVPPEKIALLTLC